MHVASFSGSFVYAIALSFLGLFLTDVKHLVVSIRDTFRAGRDRPSGIIVTFLRPHGRTEDNCTRRRFLALYTGKL